MAPDKRPGFFSTLARAAEAEDAPLPDNLKDASGTDWLDAATDSTQPATVDDDSVLEEEAPRRALTPAQAAAVQAAAAASRAARRGGPDTNISPTASPWETESQTASSPPTASPANASTPTVTSPRATSPRATSPRATSPRATSPRATSQTVSAQQKAGQPGALSDEVVAARDPASQDFSSQSAASQVRSTQTRASRVATAQNERKAPAEEAPAEEAPAEEARGAKSGGAGRLRVVPARPAISPRVLTALVGIPIVLLIVWLGGAWLVGVTLFLALVAMRELVVAARRNRTPLVIELSYPLLLIVFFSALRIGTHLRPEAAARLVAKGAQPSFSTAFALLAVYAALLALLVFAIARYAKPKPVTLISVALTILSVLYVSLLAFLPLVQGTGHGRHLIWIVLLGVWSGDTAALYAGRAWGRHKLTTLSPGKSREGLWASVLTTTAVCAGLGTAIDGLGWIHGLALGCLVAVFAPLGDLAESFWKRELNVKDLGSILPGHGGVLDRCDSLMFAAPAAYFYALWQAL